MHGLVDVFLFAAIDADDDRRCAWKLVRALIDDNVWFHGFKDKG